VSSRVFYFVATAKRCLYIRKNHGTRNRPAQPPSAVGRPPLHRRGQMGTHRAHLGATRRQRRVGWQSARKMEELQCKQLTVRPAIRRGRFHPNRQARWGPRDGNRPAVPRNPAFPAPVRPTPTRNQAAQPLFRGGEDESRSERALPFAARRDLAEGMRMPPRRKTAPHILKGAQ
jgi:hypothetical protein